MLSTVSRPVISIWWLRTFWHSYSSSRGHLFPKENSWSCLSSTLVEINPQGISFTSAEHPFRNTYFHCKRIVTCNIPTISCLAPVAPSGSHLVVVPTWHSPYSRTALRLNKTGDPTSDNNYGAKKKSHKRKHLSDGNFYWSYSVSQSTKSLQERNTHQKKKKKRIRTIQADQSLSQGFFSAGS